MNFWEIIRELLPIIIEIIRDKRESGKSLQDIQNCFKYDPVPAVKQILNNATVSSDYDSTQVILALGQAMDNPLANVFIESVYNNFDN